MGQISFHTKEILLKIVFYGPGLCGKTTTLRHIHGTIPAHKRPAMVSLDTETDRTIHFDFLPMHVAQLRGFDVRLQLYTVPGQVFYGATREIVLRGADGVVFVADSQRSRMEGNQISLDDLATNLKKLGSSIEALPIVLQYNKRDLPDILTVDEMDALFNPRGVLSFPTSATTGAGVAEVLKEISSQTIKHYVSMNRVR